MIDLTEIPSAQGGAKTQEMFELFAREFLEAIGFQCVSGPDRGADDGRDLLVVEQLQGPASVQCRRWLVSAKHFAHSGRAVGLEDEIDPEGRVRQHSADGFLAFYSTVPSAGLSRRLDALQARMPCLRYDEGRIRTLLHENSRLRGVFERYLPRSFTKVHGKEVEAKIHFLSALGFSYFSSTPGSFPGPTVIMDGETGMMRFDDSEIEAAMLAGFIFTQLKSGNFRVVEPFISFDPLVWRHLRALLHTEEGVFTGLGDAILDAADAFYCRILLSVAGEAAQCDALESICKKVLNDGWPFHQRIKESQVPVTPFFEVAQRTLVRIAKGHLAILEHYADRAREMKRWHQHSVFRSALRSA